MAKGNAPHRISLDSRFHMLTCNRTVHIVCILLSLAFLPLVSVAADSNPESTDFVNQRGDCQGQRPLRVITDTIIPFSMVKSGNHETGYALELWERVADRLGRCWVQSRLPRADTSGVVMTVSNRVADVGVSVLPITSNFTLAVDFSVSMFTSGLDVVVRHEEDEVSLLTQVFTHPIDILFVEFIAIGFLGSLVVGHLVWFAERKSNPKQFDESYINGIPAAIYWAVITASTVGYGDKAPRTGWARSIAIVWILVTLLLTSAFTANITAVRTVSAVGSQVNSITDLGNRPVAALNSASDLDYILTQTPNVRQVPDMESAYHLLREGVVDAIVADQNIIRYHQRVQRDQGKGKSPFKRIGRLFHLQQYGFILHHGSALTDQVNYNLLKIFEDGGHLDLYASYFGPDTLEDESDEDILAESLNQTTWGKRTPIIIIAAALFFVYIIFFSILKYVRAHVRQRNARKSSMSSLEMVDIAHDEGKAHEQGTREGDGTGSDLGDQGNE